jgi:hypothetical protein
LSTYEFKGDPEEVIEDLESRRSVYDRDIRFTKNGIMEYIENFFAKEESEAEKKKWEQKLDNKDVKVFIKKEGTEFSKDLPFIKAEIILNGAFKLEQVIQAIFEPHHRLLWDKQCSKIEDLLSSAT